MRAELFAPKALRNALIEAGIEDIPTERQVRRWVSGDTPMPTRIQTAIRSLLDMPAQQNAAPRIGERLDEIEMLVRAIASVSGVDLPRVEAMRRELLAELRGQQPGATSPKVSRRGQGK